MGQDELQTGRWKSQFSWQVAKPCCIPYGKRKQHQEEEDNAENRQVEWRRGFGEKRADETRRAVAAGVREAGGYGVDDAVLRDARDGALDTANGESQIPDLRS